MGSLIHTDAWIPRYWTTRTLQKLGVKILAEGRVQRSGPTAATIVVLRLRGAASSPDWGKLKKWTTTVFQTFKGHLSVRLKVTLRVVVSPHLLHHILMPQTFTPPIDPWTTRNCSSRPGHKSVSDIDIPLMGRFRGGGQQTSNKTRKIPTLSSSSLSPFAETSRKRAPFYLTSKQGS